MSFPMILLIASGILAWILSFLMILAILRERDSWTNKRLLETMFPNSSRHRTIVGSLALALGPITLVSFVLMVYGYMLVLGYEKVRGWRPRTWPARIRSWIKHVRTTMVAHRFNPFRWIKESTGM